MSKTSMAALAAVLLSSASAAATPIISGTYNVTVRDHCQPTLTADFNSGLVDALSFSSNDNYTNQQLFAATFKPSKGKVTIAGFNDEGSIFLLKSTGSQSGTQGDPLAETAASGTSNYSNTDTTFTVNDETYHILYAQIDNNGIAHAMSWLGLYTKEGVTCSNQGEATRQ